MPPSTPPRPRSQTPPFPKEESGLPDRKAVKALHDSMKSLAAAGGPIADTHRNLEEAVRQLESLGDSGKIKSDDALNCAKDALEIMDHLHLAYSEVYQNLHEGSFYVYKARSLMLQEKVGEDEPEGQ